MSILQISALALAGLLLAAFLAARFSSAEIKTQVRIDAPPAAVWAVLSDTQSHGEWNPFISAFTGDLAAGSRLSITLTPPGGAPMQIQPKVLEVAEARVLRWRGRVGFPGLFDGEHVFILEETDGGATVLRHEERFSGMLVYPLLALYGDQTEAGFNAMNAALKARVEAGERSPAQA